MTRGEPAQIEYRELTAVLGVWDGLSRRVAMAVGLGRNKVAKTSAPVLPPSGSDRQYHGCTSVFNCHIFYNLYICADC